jgi:hypothetical protein
VTSLAWRSLFTLSLPLALGACSSEGPATPADGSSGSDTNAESTSTSEGADSSTGPAAATTTTGTAESSDGTTTSSTGPATDTGNSATGEIAVCGNNVIEGNEACDLAQLNGETCQSLGYQGGQLGCLLTCDAYNLLGCFICGNGTIDLAEDCEGGVVPEGVTCQSLGYEGGQLVCGADCVYDTADCSICGDGVRQGPESCDGLDLGGATCASLGLVGGTLGCNFTTCSFDPTGCDIPGVPFGSDVGYTGYVLAPPVLPCDDISATGTPTPLTDDSQVNVPIGFTFPMYGVGFTSVTIQSNGALHFDANTYMTLANTCLPSNTAPNTNNLYVFWDDLNPAAGAGEVYYQTLGMPGDQRFVVQWDTANFGGDSVDLMRFQAVLHESTGIIDVCYVDTINAVNAGNNGAEATSGIQRDSATGLQFSCNTPDLVDGTQLLYIPL